MQNRNYKSIKEGALQAQKLVDNLMLDLFTQHGQFLLNDAEAQREYNDFTGNTFTSLAYGVYSGGALEDVFFVNAKEAIHRKVYKGETITLSTTYDGRDNVTVVGKVGISDDFGIETSVRQLEQVCPKGGRGVVITTGTEYSTFLERERDLNVLTDTALLAKVYSHSWFAGIINKHPLTPISKL